MGSNPTISGFESHHLSRSDWVRIRRPEIGKLACQAEGERITERSGVIPPSEIVPCSP
jgi:hypothetical protein